MLHPSLDLPTEEIRDIRRRYHVRELSVFGSAVRGDFRPDSDVDFLVEFEPGSNGGYLELSDLQEELEKSLQRKVDVAPKNGPKPLIRDEVLHSAEVLCAAWEATAGWRTRPRLCRHRSGSDEGYPT